jgi:hypothetical protein
MKDEIQTSPLRQCPGLQEVKNKKYSGKNWGRHEDSEEKEVKTKKDDSR